jgi:hypothetical protein
VYDTRNDSDGGAWRKKTQGLSWYDETLNTATRGGRREFPSVALIVADNTANTLTIYDLDDPSMPMWMVFTAANNNLIFNTFASYNCTSIYALNGRVYFGRASQYGLGLIDFATDDSTPIQRTSSTGGPVYKYKGTIAQRNDTLGVIDVDGNQIVNDTVNDVAATIVEGAEIGALGLPIPTVAVATAGGVSVIHPNGSVYDFKDSTATNRSYSDVRFRESGDIFAWSSMNGTAHSWYANQLYSNLSAASDLFKYDEGDNAHLPNLLSDSSQTIEVGKGSVFTGGDNGLSIVKENLANPVEGASAHITSTYNTGYMLGDIRGAWLANPSSHLDRSVKGNNLTVNGTITTGFVATDAELKYFDGFSASNYFSRAYDADFDFGTGDFSVMLWIKEASNSANEYIISRSTSGSSSHPGFYGRINTDGTTTWFSNDGSTEALVTSTQGIDDSTWHQIVFLRRSGRTALFIDGREIGSSTNAAGNMGS